MKTKKKEKVEKTRKKREKREKKIGKERTKERRISIDNKYYTLLMGILNGTKTVNINIYNLIEQPYLWYMSKRIYNVNKMHGHIQNIYIHSGLMEASQYLSGMNEWLK